MRIFAALPLAFSVATLAFACGDSEPTSASPDVPEAGTPDRTAPPAEDSGTPQLDAANDANDAADSTPPDTCPIPADATVAAQIKMSVDDNFKLYVNGVLAHEFLGTWTNVQTVNVMLNRHPAKKNVLAVEAVNGAKTTGIDRMLIADLAFTVDATEHRVVTDATWTRGTTLANGWEALDFAEAGWAAATVQGNHGDAPYGALLGTSDAKLLWSYDSAAVDTATKPVTETVYFRKTFYVSQAGAPQATPGTCN